MEVISHQALAQYMNYRGISVRDLADKTGRSRATIGHLRSGHRKHVAPDTAKKIAKALDCPLDALFVAEMVPVAPTTHRTTRRAA